MKRFRPRLRMTLTSAAAFQSIDAALVSLSQSSERVIVRLTWPVGRKPKRCCSARTRRPSSTLPEQSDMRLYDCRTAPSPRRVRIFLAEKGVQIDTVQIDLGSGEQFGDRFRKLNPDCTVPVLELDDGHCISEVIAICSYLEELYPQPPLFGKTPRERATASRSTPATAPSTAPRKSSAARCP